MLILSVFFVSLSTLAFEVLLTRVFSIGQWNHLSFMVISIALFGFGASGTFLSIVDIRASELRQRMSSDGWLFILLFFFITAVILSFMALIHLPLDYFRLPVEPIQIIYLLAAYLLLALPFFLSGLLISIAYVALPQKSGLVYFASMAGSASGAVLPIPLLPLLDEGTLIVISASLSVLPLIYSLFDQDSKNKQRLPDGRQRRILKAAGIFTLAFFISFILALKNGNLVRVAPSPYKALSQMLQFPATRILETGTGIRGRYDRVESPYIRFAPGLSLKYTGALPEQDAVFKDGDNQLVLYRSLRDPASLKFAGYMLSCSGYFLERHPENVLLILSGGGASLACAAISGANHITAIEQSANAAEALRRQCDYHIIQQNPRAFLAQNDRGFDIIQIENWGPSLPGSAALNQEHFYTIEAFAEYLNHLNPTGVIIISRRLLLPPSDSLRMWSAGFEALRRSGAGNPEDHLAILRNFDTYTLLVSKSVLNIERVKEFASGNNFDLVFLPGLNRSMANQFHIFKNAYHFEAVNHLADHYRNGLEDVYFHRYPLDIAPQSDNRPFPGRYLKWSGIKELYRSMGSRLYALFMSGEIVVSVVFLEALLVALVLLVTPLILSTRNTRRPGIYQVIYFFCGWYRFYVRRNLLH